MLCRNRSVNASYWMRQSINQNDNLKSHERVANLSKNLALIQMKKQKSSLNTKEDATVMKWKDILMRGR